ncbi:MAG TPA: dTDP-4-dehydrorhamnose 3,5-epimerase [Steroidobacteraceae bacterium]|nr:dTDP-4-dehydrorhamnose 3,5-epimerase [Steroidobacteraceae bacterium]
MQFEPTAIPDVVLIRPKVFGDARGFFLESWEERKFAAAGIDAKFVQDNHSRSARHTLRGLHYQIQQTQGKLVRVVSGTVFDVAVDIRRSSPTFGRWVGVTLSAENHEMLWVPPGLAHGFLVLSDSADFLYRCTDFYAPPHERAIRWDDPDLGVKWPLPTGAQPLLSPKDAVARGFRDAECFP